MDSLTPTLKAAQQSPSSEPFVEAVLSDVEGGGARCRLGRVYEGDEPASHVAACVSGDGSLVRARVDGATLYTSRVASPSAASSFSAWASHGGVSRTDGPVALCSSGASVYLFYVHTDSIGLRMKVSSDNGASWSVASTLSAPADEVLFLAADVNTAGEVLLLWTLGDPATDLWAARYAGSWSTPASWGKAVDQISGVAVYWRFDFQVCVSGIEATSQDAKVWMALYGDGFNTAADSWSSLLAIVTANDGSSYAYDAPALQFASGYLRLFYTEHFAGSPATRRLYETWLDGAADATQDLWREPYPLDYDPPENAGLSAALDFANGMLWLVAANGVWLGTLGGIPDLDVSQRVVSASAELREQYGRAVVELDNHDGALTSAPQLTRGMRLSLKPGYRTAAGSETAPSDRHYWVEAVELLTGPRPRVVLHCRDAWWLLERWRSGRQHTWPVSSMLIFGVLEKVIAKAALRVSADEASALLQLWEPAITISPGESGLNVVRRLLAFTADVMRFAGATASIIEPAADEESLYAYGGSHAILRARYRDDGPGFNLARVVGLSAYAEGVAAEDIAATGLQVSPPVVDLNLFDASLTEGRAAIEIRRRRMRSRSDDLTVFGINCGQELYDVVSVTDAAAGLESAKRRVLGLSWRYDTLPRLRHEMTLTLGNP